MSGEPKTIFIILLGFCKTELTQISLLGGQFSCLQGCRMPLGASGKLSRMWGLGISHCESHCFGWCIFCSAPRSWPCSGCTEEQVWSFPLQDFKSPTLLPKAFCRANVLRKTVPTVLHVITYLELVVFPCS